MAGPASVTLPATNDLWTAALADAYGTALNQALAPAQFVGYSVATASFTHNTWQGVPIDTELDDTVGGHSTSVNTDRYTIQTGWDGDYQVTIRTAWTANGTGVRGAAVGKNNLTQIANTITQVPGTAGGVVCVQTTTILPGLVAGDYIQFLGFQNSGGALSTVASESEVTVRWVHQ